MMMDEDVMVILPSVCSSDIARALIVARRILPRKKLEAREEEVVVLEKRSCSIYHNVLRKLSLIFGLLSQHFNDSARA